MKRAHPILCTVLMLFTCPNSAGIDWIPGATSPESTHSFRRPSNSWHFSSAFQKKEIFRRYCLIRCPLWCAHYGHPLPGPPSIRTYPPCTSPPSQLHPPLFSPLLPPSHSAH